MPASAVRTCSASVCSGGRDGYTEVPAPVGDRRRPRGRGLAVHVPVLHPLPARGRPALLVLQLHALPGADAGLRHDHRGSTVQRDRGEHGPGVRLPTTLGIEHRIVNGRVYITAIPVLDDAEIGRRAAIFGERASYYYENWDSLYEGWKVRMRALIDSIESVTVPSLPEFENASVVFQARGVLTSPEEQAAFDQMLGLCRRVFPFVEDHKFY